MAVAIVAYGRSQSGKSTTLGKLKQPGQVMPQIGDGDGESVTERAHVIDTELGLAVDTPGIDDTKLRFTEDDAGRRVALGMAASGAEKMKFVIFESLANDAIQLRGTIETFCRAFGAPALGSAVVLATKADLLREQVREKRLTRLGDIVQEFKLPYLVLWQNEGLDESGHALQLASLRRRLDSIEATSTVDLQDLRDRQRIRAEEKYAAQVPQQKETMVEVEESYVESHEEQQPYEEQYIDQVPEIEDYEEPETYEEAEEHSHSYEKRRAGLAGIFGSTESVTDCFNIDVQKVRMVKRQRKIRKDVVKTRTAYRTVTEHDQKTRTTSVPKTVEYLLPVESFMAEALEEISQDIRLSLKSGESEISFSVEKAGA